ncbi:hypothetical protein [Streptomyces sp. NBC_00576]|uniref:hypothetical protein n=1 Tax=Streptomyces sp. NBC_00576 TaxID=2903665 RepID=UPI002E81547B|nr:hypothetical protein [Streptomyces sp. NBC_00576]WUB75857.1 hypothetical protein OG734_40620 [Streptomyces sp. NBC_00576]
MTTASAWSPVATVSATAASRIRIIGSRSCAPTRERSGIRRCAQGPVRAHARHQLTLVPMADPAFRTRRYA